MIHCAIHWSCPHTNFSGKHFKGIRFQSMVWSSWVKIKFPPKEFFNLSPTFPDFLSDMIINYPLYLNQKNRSK